MFGWAFLGCGNIAEQVANELVNEAGQRIVSCWNRSLERAEKLPSSTARGLIGRRRKR